MTGEKRSTGGKGPVASKKDEEACKHGLEMRGQNVVPSKLGGCVTLLDVVPSGGHGCEPHIVVFWSAWPQTAGKEGEVLREPGRKKMRKSEEIYKLVRATAALQRNGLNSVNGPQFGT